MQRKEFIQKIKYYRRRIWHDRRWCPAAGGTAPDRPGMQERQRVNSSNINNAADEIQLDSASFFDSEKNDSSFADGAKQTAESSVTAQISLLIPKAANTVSTKSKHVITPDPPYYKRCGRLYLGTDEAFDYSTSLNAYFENYGKEYFYRM